MKQLLLRTGQLQKSAFLRDSCIKLYKSPKEYRLRDKSAGIVQPSPGLLKYLKPGHNACDGIVLGFVMQSQDYGRQNN